MNPMSSDLRRVRALEVRLHGRRVGIINRFGGDRNLFDFEPDYVEDPNRPTLSLSFKSRSGGLVPSVRPTTTRVPPFFSNLLPEGPLRAYLAERAGVSPEREFFLLAVLGADLPGAVTVSPLDGGDTIEHPGDAADARTDEEPGRKVPLRFSLAGVQLKFSAIAEASGGLTIPADGVGGFWIVKLPSLRFPSVPENELAMMTLARASGITVPEVRLVSVESIQGLPRDVARVEGQALAIKRFDRTSDGERIHIEDFAQVFGLFPDKKYERKSYANIASVLWAETGEEDAYELVRRLVFSVLIGNGDMHLKNWSLRYADRRTPELAPAYDLVSTIPYIPDDTLGLTFGRSRSLSEITRDQVRRFADTARLPNRPLWRIVTETSERALDAWRALDVKDVLPADVRAAIQTQIETVATSVSRG